jgi:hypothetical protein
MRRTLVLESLMLLWILLSGSSFAQNNNPRRTLVINGQTGEAEVVLINGREYIDLRTLVRIANGSMSFQDNRIIVLLPVSDVSRPAAVPAEHNATSDLSQEFVKAGIEVIALMREWASSLAYAIQNGYPISEQSVTGYREQAATSLRLASAQGKTESDRNALRLLSNEFQAVLAWSNKLVEARKSMDTAKYAMSDSALRNDPLSQKIVACAHFLGPMLGSGTFQDDPSCHWS